MDQTTLAYRRYNLPAEMRRGIFYTSSALDTVEVYILHPPRVFTKLIYYCTRIDYIKVNRATIRSMLSLDLGGE